jgi:hypothetical protein
MCQLFPLVGLLCVFAPIRAAEPQRLSFEDADARLRHVFFLAKETNDTSIVDRVLEMRDGVKRSFARKDLAAAEGLIRDAEEAVGLDRGGKTMLGLPVAHLDAETQKRVSPVNEKLGAALKNEDATAVSSSISELSGLLGDQAGLPDIRQKGERAKVVPTQPAEVADLFLNVIQFDPRAYKALVAGVPGPATMPRAYAAIVRACLTVRPVVEQFHKARLPVIDDAIRGCCKAMLALQLESGYFRFPDLRGKSILIGEAIDKLIEADASALKDGWIERPFLDGSSRHEAAECGIALLEAGKALNTDEWRMAAAKVRALASRGMVSPGFRYNASAVSFLCRYARISGGDKDFAVANSIYRVGVASGQTKNGRWLDPQDSRTENLFLFLRAQHDLIEAMPAGKERNEIVAASVRLVGSILEESGALGVPLTSLTIQELGRHARLVPDALAALRAALAQAAAATIEKSNSKGRLRAAVPLPELAASVNVWAK